jgi:hypothetical protein
LDCNHNKTIGGHGELHTLPELRTMMPTKEEARRERNRVYKHRRRAAGQRPTRLPQPSPKPLPRSHPAPFDAEDLAADFFAE